MNDWLDYEFTVGLPHMLPNRLSEVELLKWLGAFQWDSIASRLGRRSSAIVNGQGERLYASFVDVELSFPPALPLESFEEGARVSVRNRVSAYARRFVEGMFVFDVAPIPVEETEAITTREELARCGRPWCYLTNAFVARAGSNSRLRVFEPEGMDAAGFPVLARRRRESRGTRSSRQGGSPLWRRHLPRARPCAGRGCRSNTASFRRAT